MSQHKLVCAPTRRPIAVSPVTRLLSWVSAPTCWPALTAVLVLVSAGSAGAAVTASRITTPEGPVYYLAENALPEGQRTTHIAVSGVATGEGEVELRCYYGPEPLEYETIDESPVKVTEGHFSAQVSPEIEVTPPQGRCVLRAVPAEAPGGEPEARPPGSASPFEGPVIAGSEFKLATEPLDGDAFTYSLNSNTSSAYLRLSSAGDCGLEASSLYTPDSLIPSAPLFDCDAVLDQLFASDATRPDLQIDGANAYTPWAADRVVQSQKQEIPGTPQLAVTKSFDASDGAAVVKEIDPLVRCAPEDVYPPTATSCKFFESAGVELERTWQIEDSDHVAQMIDIWRSTDDLPHQLDTSYVDVLADAEPNGASVEFPGNSTFSATSHGSTLLPAGPGAIFYKSDRDTPDTGDETNPQGAIVYDNVPSEPLAIIAGSEEPEESQFEAPYQRAIPAGGAAVLRMAFLQAYALSEVRTLAAGVLAGFPPTVTIASPSNASTIAAESATVTVTGTAADTGALSSVTVDGVPVSVSGEGDWSTSAALKAGPNTITVTATDQAGLTSTESSTVTYVPPASGGGPTSSANPKAITTTPIIESLPGSGHTAASPTRPAIKGLSARQLVIDLNTAGRAVVKIARQVGSGHERHWRIVRTITVNVVKAGKVTVRLPRLASGSYRLTVSLGGRTAERTLTVPRRSPPPK